MIIHVKKVEGAVLPVQASKKDENGNLVKTNAAGYDIVATSGATFWRDKQPITDAKDGYSRIDYVQYETNLFVSPSVRTYHSLIFPRSSISNYNLVLANSVGLVDNDYRGQVFFRFKYIWQPEDFQLRDVYEGSGYKGQKLVGAVNYDKIYKKGDTLGQFVLSPTVYAEYQFTDDLDKTVRGEGGFGHTTPDHAPMTLEDRLRAEKADFDAVHGKVREHKSVLDKYKEMGATPAKVPYSELVKQAQDAAKK